MVSALGLKVTVSQKGLDKFWRNRLSKLLIPCLITNLLSVFFELLKGKSVSTFSFIMINTWVLQLILFYFIFWITTKIRIRLIGGDTCACILVIIFSICSWQLQIGWAVPSWGFVFGIVLFNKKEAIARYNRKTWLDNWLP